MALKHLLSVLDYDKEGIEDLLKLSKKLKKDRYKNKYSGILKQKSIGMLFKKTSTRTRVSFEVGIHELGGKSLYLEGHQTQLSKGESVHDTIKVLSRYIDGLVIRTYEHSELEEFKKYSEIPIVNALTNEFHPCQAITDIFTIYEVKKKLRGLKFCYIGDANNMANSLALVCGLLGINFFIASPKSYEIEKSVMDKILPLFKKNKADFVTSDNPADIAKNADVLYTDVWVSMGQEGEKEKRLHDFKGFCIDNKIGALAKKDHIVLHCLPAIRGLEITDDIIDGPNSVVFDQAENRLHVQKAILVDIFSKQK